MLIHINLKNLIITQMFFRVQIFFRRINLNQYKLIILTFNLQLLNKHNHPNNTLYLPKYDFYIYTF